MGGQRLCRFLLHLISPFLFCPPATSDLAKGRVTSFWGVDLQGYTSFRAHPPTDGPVRQLLFCDKGVIALGPRSVHMALRRGPPLWHIRYL